MSARRHPASLLPTSLHNPQLLSLVREHVTYEMVLYVAQQTIRSVPLAEEVAPSAALPTPPHTPLKTKFSAEDSGASNLPPLAEFIASIVDSSRVQIPVLLATVLFLDRLRVKLPKVAKGLPCTRHRVFLATLIVAAKYLNDSSPKNKHWALYARLFDINEINLMEKQLLFLLDYDLRFDEAEALTAFKPFLRPTVSPSVGTVSTRQKAVNRVAEASKARVQAQLPPTPPHELDRLASSSSTYAGVATSATTTAAQTLATTVNSIARRLSKTYLGGAPLLTTPARELTTRTASAASAVSGAESEASMGALTEDTGSTTESSSDELPSEDEEGEDERDNDQPVASQSFSLTLPPTSALSRRRVRKASDTVTIAAHDSCASPDELHSGPSIASVSLASTGEIVVIKQHQPEPIPTPAISSRRSLRLRRATYGESKLPQSRTMPSLASPSRTPAAPPPSVASSFLSRVWGVATKGAVAATGGSIDVATAEPETTQRGLRRLAHSRSTMFRGTQHNVAADVEA